MTQAAAQSSASAAADVIVVGAGPAGSSAAYHMATLGLDVLLLEKNELGDGGGGEAERFCGSDDGAAFLDFEEHLHTSDVVDGHIFLPGALGIALAVVATVFHGASLIVDSCIWYRAGFRPALFETSEVGCRHVGLCSEYFRAECDDSWG